MEIQTRVSVLQVHNKTEGLQILRGLYETVHLRASVQVEAAAQDRVFLTSEVKK